jgi:hypothetical protein
MEKTISNIITEENIQKAMQLLQNEFGTNWETVMKMAGTQDLRTRVGKKLTSFMSFPQRGEGGDSKWRGNCSPEVIKAAAEYVLSWRKHYGYSNKHFTLLDPMSGSGTSKPVGDSLGIETILYDLNPNPIFGKGNWNALKDDVEHSADLIFLHTPYHNIIQYSGNMWGKPNPDDLSRCENYKDFIEKLNFVIKKLYMALRKNGRLAVLVGDCKSKGQFMPIQSDMMKIGNYESFIVKAQHNCVSDTKTYNTPFIPIVTEYLLMFQKTDIFMVPFSKTIKSTVDIRSIDDPTLTWNHLIRMLCEYNGGKAKLQDLYTELENHPKAKKNKNWKERIRATIYERKDQYISLGSGEYELSYMAS